ncbi:MAG: hypothetical protein RLY70_4647, partial [Planctomycetota bacterium]
MIRANRMSGGRKPLVSTGLALMTACFTAGGGAVAGRLEAGENAKCAGPKAKIAVTVEVGREVSETRVLLAELTRLCQPVQVRVAACETDLLAARRGVVAALRQHDTAKNSAQEALVRVETVACVLRTMCQTLEVNGVVYSKEQVAAGLRKLIADYRLAADEVESAADQLERRSENLRQVAARVTRWRKQEQALLEQVDSLKNEHNVDSTSDRAATAAKLVAEVSEMLAKPAPARVASDNTESSAATSAAVRAQDSMKDDAKDGA